MDSELPFRVGLAVMLAGAVTISGHHRRRARIASGTIPRGSESPGLILARIVFGLPILLSLLTYIVQPGWLRWSQVPLPPAARWTGVATGIVCVALVYWVVSSLGSNISETVLTRPDHALVTHGPYRWVRHPLYACGLLLLFSAALMTANVVVGALTIAIAITMRLLVVPAEEAALIERFGERYERYIARTGSLLPRIANEL